MATIENPRQSQTLFESYEVPTEKNSYLSPRIRENKEILKKYAKQYMSQNNMRQQLEMGKQQIKSEIEEINRQVVQRERRAKDLKSKYLEDEERLRKVNDILSQIETVDHYRVNRSLYMGDLDRTNYTIGRRRQESAEHLKKSNRGGEKSSNPLAQSAHFKSQGDIFDSLFQRPTFRKNYYSMVTEKDGDIVNQSQNGYMNYDKSRLNSLGSDPNMKKLFKSEVDAITPSILQSQELDEKIQLFDGYKSKVYQKLNRKAFEERNRKPGLFEKKYAKKEHVADDHSHQRADVLMGWKRRHYLQDALHLPVPIEQVIKTRPVNHVNYDNLRDYF